MRNEELALASTCHGKANIKVAKINRNSDGLHDILELSVCLQLFGGTENSFRSGVNEGVVPTDTCRNHVYLHAKANEFQNCEQFAIGLATRMLKLYEHIQVVKVVVEEKPWERVVLDGKPHNHGFVNSTYGAHKCYVNATRSSIKLSSALDSLSVLKTTQSGWSNFLKDKYTTLQETSERVLATKISAEWIYVPRHISELQRLDFDSVRRDAKLLLLTTLFGPVDSGTFSNGVQNTLYKMAASIIQAIPCVMSVTLSLPNLHYLPCDLPVMERNGFHFENDIYIPTDAPHGTISATITRPFTKL